MRYQLLQIKNGKETVLLDTDSKQEIRNHYDRDDMLRIRVDGRILLIFQAEDWLNNLPIREYRIKRPSIEIPVIQKNEAGEEIARFHSVAEAARETGCKSVNNVTRACRTGRATRTGLWFAYA